MDLGKKDSKLCQQYNSATSRSYILSDLKHRVNVQSAKFADAQQEIEQLKVILTDANRRLEIMKKRNVDKSC